MAFDRKYEYLFSAIIGMTMVMVARTSISIGGDHTDDMPPSYFGFYFSYYYISHVTNTLPLSRISTK